MKISEPEEPPTLKHPSPAEAFMSLLEGYIALRTNRALDDEIALDDIDPSVIYTEIQKMIATAVFRQMLTELDALCENREGWCNHLIRLDLDVMV